MQSFVRRSQLFLSLAAAVFTVSTPAIAQTHNDDDAAPPSRLQSDEQREREREAQRDAPGVVRETGPGIDIPDHLAHVADIVYVTAPAKDADEIELKFDAVFRKDNANQSMPVVIYIHGGGYRAGNKETALPLMLPLAERGFFAVTVQYRLSPQATYPAAIEDVKAAVCFLRDHADELGIDANRIGVWGHSAGGHLAAMLAATSSGDDPFAITGHAGGGGDCDRVQCAVVFAGPIDFLNPVDDLTRGMVEEWFGGTRDEKHDAMVQASPMSHIDASDPPMLIIHGSDDELVPVAKIEAWMAALEKAGADAKLIRLEGESHAIRDRAVYLSAVEFFEKRLKASAPQAE